MIKQATSNLSDKLRDIETRKSALQNIIDIATQMEYSQAGLRTLLMLGKNTDQTPDQSMGFFKAINAHFQELSSAKIHDSLKSIEQKISNDLSMVLLLTQEESSEELDLNIPFSDGEETDIDILLNEFRRRTQTAISLRIILQKRGVQLDGMIIPIPKNSIQRRIQELNKRQKFYSKRIEEEMQSMHQDIEVLLGTHDLSKNIIDELKHNQVRLDKNISHIQSGKTIEDLPYNFDSLTEEEDTSSDSDFFTSLNKVSMAKTNTSSEQTDETTDVETIEIKPRGFFMQLFTWLTTPGHVSWDQARTWKKR